jgi:RND family efflux transporter MFP subunit
MSTVASTKTQESRGEEQRGEGSRPVNSHGKQVFIAVLIGIAWAGGYGYGRWYGNTGSGHAERKVLYWVDPMHPWYKSDKAGIAPDCNMKLVPVYEGEAAKYEKRASGLPPGTVGITPEKQQLIGIEYGTADYTSAGDSIRAVAKVALDETRVAKVQTKIEGWIDQVYVDFTGKVVEKGQPLLTIYSPEALATQQELLLAMKAQHQMHDSPVHELMGSTENLVAAARKRLELWDITEEQVDRIVKTGEPMKNLTLYAPIGGYVMERNAFPRQRITPDTMLYTVADLSSVWVIADVYEYEAANVKLNQPADFTLAYLPGRVFHGKVSYVMPQVDPNTRTMKVRIQLENPGNVLKQEMYGDVELKTGGARVLTVPQSAVLNSGQRQVVFVDHSNGYLEPREVKVGTQYAGRIEIRGGLKAGERIVVSGNFLVDSESQIQAATAGTR